jgi:hypothetical protein
VTVQLCSPSGLHSCTQLVSSEILAARHWHRSVLVFVVYTCCVRLCGHIHMVCACTYGGMHIMYMYRRIHGLATADMGVVAVLWRALGSTRRLQPCIAHCSSLEGGCSGSMHQLVTCTAAGVVFALCPGSMHACSCIQLPLHMAQNAVEYLALPLAGSCQCGALCLVHAS